ncbi:MAG: TraR/DksA C4-type zinc finger protein [Patescibacteria group bacterium]
MGEGYEVYDKLREILGNQSQNLLNEIKQRKLNIRAEKIGCFLCDDGSGEAIGCNDNFEIHLIQMKIGMLNKIEYVLEQLETGIYGKCSGCKVNISEDRLKAIPFAIRCKDCEEKYELDH